MSEERDCATLDIDRMLSQWSDDAAPSNPKIFKVDDHLRRVNEKAYDPGIVAIGPIHHNKDHVKDMERHKVRYLHQLLKRRGKKSVEEYVTQLEKLEEKARKYYMNPIQMSHHDFVKMLLLDGFFVIELVRKYYFDKLRDQNDYIFQFDRLLSHLIHDFLLMENQLPFFVLNQLFEMTKLEDPDDDLQYLVLFLVDGTIPWQQNAVPRYHNSVQNVDDHLLGLVYRAYFSFEHVDSSRKQSNSRHSYGLEDYSKLDDINSTSELKEAGIQLKSAKGISLWDLRFANGVMQLPKLNVSDETESILMNFIAYEQFLSNGRPKYVTDYAFLMHCLVKSTKDVAILRLAGIISNWLGDDETVRLMFNKLGKNILRSPSDFCYSVIFHRVNRHCRLPRNKWMAKLKRSYFDSPWVFLLFLVVALLNLQTTFLILSYRRGTTGS